MILSQSDAHKLTPAWRALTLYDTVTILGDFLQSNNGFKLNLTPLYVKKQYNIIKNIKNNYTNQRIVFSFDYK